MYFVRNDVSNKGNVFTPLQRQYTIQAAYDVSMSRSFVYQVIGNICGTIQQGLLVLCIGPALQVQTVSYRAKETYLDAGHVCAGIEQQCRSDVVFLRGGYTGTSIRYAWLQSYQESTGSCQEIGASRWSLGDSYGSLCIGVDHVLLRDQVAVWQHIAFEPLRESFWIHVCRTLLRHIHESSWKE